MNIINRCGPPAMLGIYLSAILAAITILYFDLQEKHNRNEGEKLELRSQLYRLGRVFSQIQKQDHDTLRVIEETAGRAAESALREYAKEMKVLDEYRSIFESSLPTGEHYPIGKQIAEWNGYKIEVDVTVTNATFRILGTVPEKTNNL